MEEKKTKGETPQEEEKNQPEGPKDRKTEAKSGGKSGKTRKEPPGTIQWRLFQVMAGKNIRTAAKLQVELKAAGVDLSPAHISRIVKQMPDRLSMDLFAALLEVLDCQPNDLIRRVGKSATPESSGPGEIPEAKASRKSGGGRPAAGSKPPAPVSTLKIPRATALPNPKDGK
jgi:DNA-binding Xre family transcriptional regulator